MDGRKQTRGDGAIRVVITAGPTREWLDDVRFLSNASTGRMGQALALAARARGAEVTLVLGPSSLPPPDGVTVVRVVTTHDLLEATRGALHGADLVFFAAAPSDFRPLERRRGKPAREGGAFTLALTPTEDVAKTLGADKDKAIHVGFALEVEDGVARARAKSVRKHFDAIVLNSPQNFGEGGGQASWIGSGSAPPEPLPTTSKEAMAEAILARAWRLLPPPKHPA